MQVEFRPVHAGGGVEGQHELHRHGLRLRRVSRTAHRASASSRAAMPRHILPAFPAKTGAMMNRRSLLLSPALLLALASGAFASDIMVMNAVAPKSLTPTAQTAAIYLMLMNHGSAADTVTKLETPVAAHAMMHQSVEEDGVMKMREVEAFELKAVT